MRYNQKIVADCGCTEYISRNKKTGYETIKTVPCSQHNSFEYIFGKLKT